MPPTQCSDCDLTGRELGPEHLHGHHVDAEQPDGAVQDVRAAAEGDHADALPLQLPAMAPLMCRTAQRLRSEAILLMHLSITAP